MSIFGDYKDLDGVLISFLDIDDLRNLYRINRYYHDLIKPKLQDYITAFTNNRDLIESLSKTLQTNNIRIVKYFCEKILLTTENHIFDFVGSFVTNVDINKNILDYIESIGKIYSFERLYNMIINSSIKGWINVLTWSLNKIILMNGELNIYEKVFMTACQFGNLDILKYVFIQNQNYDYQEAFKLACENNRLCIVQWLLSLNKHINIRKNNDQIFRLVCEAGHVDIIEFLCSQIPEYAYETEYIVRYKYVIKN